MKERIILAPGINGDELLRSLAANNVNCFNVRIMNAVGLARYGLMKSGVSITEQFVSKQEEIALVSKAVSGSAYFKKATYADIVDLTNAIRMMRFFVSSDDEAGVLSEVLPKGIFREKNNAILAAYNEYIKVLEGVDSIGLIRKAIKECKGFDADFEMITEIPLKPLERKLLETLSAGSFNEITIRDLYGAEDKGIRISSYKNCYGSPNEAEDILTDIYSEKCLDKSMIAVTDTRTYSQIFFDQAINRTLPITFGCGIPITNSNPAKLLDLYNKWMTTGLFSAASLDALLSSDAFDRKAFIGDFECPEAVKIKDLFALLGQLKLSNNLKENQAKVASYIETIPETDRNTAVEEQLKLWAAELSLPCEEFINKYAKIRAFGEDYVHVLLNRLDSTALSTICNSLAVVRSAGIDQQAEDVISDLLSTMICYQRSEPGKLHVTDINSAISSVRGNIYIAGLSANNYPGTPKENYLLLDEDVRLFGEGMEVFTSPGRIKVKKDRLFTLAKLATGLKCDIHVSFAGFNVSELKNQNASSMVFDLFRAENGDSSTVKELEASIKKVEYFVSKKRTYEAAAGYKGQHVAVHNFASASNPGGGVVNGASAQEECLCRCSGLYFNLNTPAMWDGFYQPHRDAHDPIHNDDIIYTPNVTVFKSDIAMPKLMAESDWYDVDVITCAAPNLRSQPSNRYNSGDGNRQTMMKDKDLLALHEKRLRRILEVALSEGCDTIILGAFGCGAFQNNPEVVALANRNVIKDYLHAFKNIEFAVYCSPRDERNFKIFERVLKTYCG